MKTDYLDSNQVYCLDVFSFLEKIEDYSIGLAIVDPPYNMKKGAWDIFKSEEDYFGFTFNWLDKLIPKLNKNASLYLFNNPYNSAIICNHLRSSSLDFRNWITWHKKDGFSASKRSYVNAQEIILYYTKGNDYIFNYDSIRVEYESTQRIEHARKKGILKNGKRWFPNPLGKLCTDVWEYSSYRHKNKVNGKVVKTEHPTPKPEGMIKRMIQASSDESTLVLDLFSGTGTTSVIAQNLRRQFIGCESNEFYCSLIESRGVEIGRL